MPWFWKGNRVPNDDLEQTHGEEIESGFETNVSDTLGAVDVEEVNYTSVGWLGRVAKLFENAGGGDKH